MKPFIFFDVGGTLLHFRPSYGERLAAACRDAGVEVYADEAAARVTAIRAALGGAPDPVDLAANRAWWFAFFDEFLRPHGLADAAAVRSELWRRHRAGDWLTPADDTRDTLARLAAAGHAMGVISNWDDTLEAILERRGLLAFFRVVVASCSARSAKPEPEIFRAAMHAAGVSPKHAVHVGDDPTADAAGALAVGIRPVLVAPRDAGAPARVEVIETLGDLLRLPAIGG
jgi:putative hydrolase of the HAD superfamily